MPFWRFAWLYARLMNAMSAIPSAKENILLSDPDRPVIVLDTETTGLDHKTERMIEIAAVKLHHGSVVEMFDSLINPGIPIRSSSQKVHGISQEDVESAPPIEEVLPKFLDFVGDEVYVAHNALFDYSFINEAKKRLYDGQKFSNPRVDTYEMYRKVFPEDPSHGLSSLLARFGLPSYVKHRALDDALNLAKCYPKLRDLYHQQYHWQLQTVRNSMPYVLERFYRLQDATKALQSELLDIKELLKLYFEEGGSPITVLNGETITWGYRRTYSYDNDKVWKVLEEAGLLKKAAKLNPKLVDRLMSGKRVDDEVRDKLFECRQSMRETRVLNFEKAAELSPAPQMADDDPANRPPVAVPDLEDDDEE